MHCKGLGSCYGSSLIIMNDTHSIVEIGTSHAYMVKYCFILLSILHKLTQYSRTSLVSQAPYKLKLWDCLSFSWPLCNVPHGLEGVHMHPGYVPFNQETPHCSEGFRNREIPLCTLNREDTHTAWPTQYTILHNLAAWLTKEERVHTTLHHTSVIPDLTVPCQCVAEHSVTLP